MKAKKVYEFQRNGKRNPYQAAGVGSLEILKKFSENYIIEDWSNIFKANCGFEIKNNNIIVDPYEMQYQWHNYPDSIKSILIKRVPEKLPNSTKSDDELMEQALEATDILKQHGFEILKIPEVVNSFQNCTLRGNSQ